MVQAPRPAPNRRPPRCSPESQDKPDLHKEPEKGAAKLHSSKRCRNRSAYLGPARCAYRGQRRSGTWQNHSARPPSLTLSVHGVREGPAPRAPVSSLWALPCPLPVVSDPLGGADALPFPSSRGGTTAADLVKPRAKGAACRIRAMADLFLLPKDAETGQPV